MNEDVVEDLKQFITATVSQQTADVVDKLETKIDKLDLKLSTKIDDLSDAVAEALDSANEAVDVQLKDHEARIGRLEQKAA